MFLNLGSGTHPTSLPNWIDVDIGGIDPDVHANAFALPFKDSTFKRAYLGHFLEHINWADLKELGTELRRVMVSRATVMVVGPDIVKAMQTNQPESILRAISDLCEGAGGHKWVADEAKTKEAMILMGLTGLVSPNIGTVTPPTWPNSTTASWQCAIWGLA